MKKWEQELDHHLTRKAVWEDKHSDVLAALVSDMGRRGWVLVTADDPEYYDPATSSFCTFRPKRD